MTSPPLEWDVVVSAPFEENTYVAWLAGASDCLIFDPGLDPQGIVDLITERGLTPVAILITHGHSDHIAGNGPLKRRYPDCPILIGRGDAPKLTDPWQNLSGQFGVPLTSPPADRLLDDGERFEFGGIELLTLEIPGHSSGHVVFVWTGAKPAVVFGGDVLFAGSIGRTDFPDGDFDTLERGIQTKLYTLPNDTIVLPGHGPETTVGVEKRTNPYVKSR